VTALRKIYGPGFFLIGVYAPEDERTNHLVKDRKLSKPEAAEVIERDANEEIPFGQQTRATFQLADVFIRAGDPDQLRRFVRLVFGALHETPTEDEHGMFLAYVGSLRSGSLARQVGAVVRTAEGEFVTTGANDVPRFGGGLYWPGLDDKRDATWRGGVDSNDAEIAEIVRDTVSRVKPSSSLLDEGEILRRLRGGRLYDLTEFGRAVHAEMDALLSCARLGVSPRNGTLYTTTFPCHNCAKHIVAAGLKKVFYVEPYPKSKALDLHSDSIALSDAECGDKVQFAPFVGVGARKYFDLFSMKLSAGYPLLRKTDGKAAEWREKNAKPRVQLPPASYIVREQLAVTEIAESKAIRKLRRT
jgi:deoxycytidylate deaminase